jgi:hypothetical protein
MALERAVRGRERRRVGRRDGGFILAVCFEIVLVGCVGRCVAAGRMDGAAAL